MRAGAALVALVLGGAVGLLPLFQVRPGKWPKTAKIWVSTGRVPAWCKNFGNFGQKRGKNIVNSIVGSIPPGSPGMNGGLALEVTSDGGFIGTGQHEIDVNQSCDLYVYKSCNMYKKIIMYYAKHNSLTHDNF